MKKIAMKNIATVKIKAKENALKYAYAFMQTKLLNMKECSFINPNPTKINNVHVFPRDMYSASYDDKVPAWEKFKTNQTHISSPGFTCVGCLDAKDQKRMVCASLGDNVLFNIYGDYENEAKKALDDIVLIHSSLN